MRILDSGSKAQDKGSSTKPGLQDPQVMWSLGGLCALYGFGGA